MFRVDSTTQADNAVFVPSSKLHAREENTCCLLTYSFVSELLARASTSVARVFASSTVSLHATVLFLSQRDEPVHGETS